MFYRVNVEATTTYEVIVVAETPADAETEALDMDFNEMRELDSSIEVVSVYQENEP